MCLCSPVPSSRRRARGSAKNGVMVPEYLFKLVFNPSKNRAWAHWQENREGERVGRPISYRELVERTGVQFLPGWRL